jgi:thioredoxin-related protein
MLNIRLCIFLSACFLLFTIAVPAESLFLDLSIDQALARAKAEDKFVLIAFFSEDCGPCRRLDTITFADERVIEWIGRHTVPLRIGTEQEQELANLYYVRSKATLVFLRPDGVELDRFHGYRPAGIFLETAGAVIEHPEKDAVARARAELEEGKLPQALVRRKLAFALAVSGKPDQALAELNKALEGLGTDNASRSTRRTVLKAICTLSQNYPPAGEEMENLRGELVRRIEAGEADASDVEQITAIDEGLDQQDRTLELYQALKTKGVLSPRLTAGFSLVCRELLLEDRQYEALVAEFPFGLNFQALMQVRSLKIHRDMASGDFSNLPEAEAREMEKHLNRQMEGMSEELRASMIAHQETDLIGEIGETYQIALGVGKTDVATLAAEQLLELSPTAEAYHVLAANALRSGKPTESDLSYAEKAVELDKGENPEYAETRDPLLELFGPTEEGEADAAVDQQD